MRRLLLPVLGFVLAAAVSACGPEVDLGKSVQLVDIHSGYLDLGIVNGKTKIVPTATVHVKNVSDHELGGFQMSASYWIAGDDGMKDELTIPNQVAKSLAPGATSDGIELTAHFGYTLDVSRAEAFQNSVFRDFTIKVFGKVGGRIVKVGEFKVDQKIVPKTAAVPTV